MNCFVSKQFSLAWDVPNQNELKPVKKAQAWIEPIRTSKPLNCFKQYTNSVQDWAELLPNS